MSLAHFCDQFTNQRYAIVVCQGRKLFACQLAGQQVYQGVELFVDVLLEDLRVAEHEADLRVAQAAQELAELPHS